MSSYRGNDLFGSGPHRFGFGARAQQVVSNAAFYQDPTQVGSGSYGNREFDIVVKGRLVAATEAALWTLRSAIHAEVDVLAGTATLVDSFGRSHETVRLVEYEEEAVVSRGRRVSMGYRAVFRRLLNDP